jgi:hypothetical protein
MLGEPYKRFLTISKEADDKLQWLAEDARTTREPTVEKLINDAYERLMFQKEVDATTPEEVIADMKKRLDESKKRPPKATSKKRR